MAHKIVLLDLAQPCTACLITDNLLKEVFAKVRQLRPDVETDNIVLDNMRQLKDIPGVEVEKLPIVMIDGEQVTAGDFVTPRKILEMLDAMDKGAYA